MAKKQQLFWLIKSLTKAEKRYFRLFAGAGGDNQNYARLFDFIDSQAEYDEAAIKRKFKNEKFIKQLHVTKNYLDKLILKSLRNFHANTSKDAELNDLLRDIEILYSRELYDQCHATIAKALAIAHHFEKHHILLEVCEWKRKLLLARSGAGNARQELNALLEQERQSLQKLTTLNRYWELATNAVAFAAPKTRDELQDPAAVPQHPLLQSRETADTLQSRVLYCHVLYSYYFFRGDLEQAEESIRSLVELLEARPERLKENPSSYLTGLNNYIGLCLRAKKLDAIPALLDKIRSALATYGLDPKSRVTIKTIVQTFNVELELYRDSGDFTTGIAVVERARDYLEQHGDRVAPEYRHLLQYQFAYLYFMKRNHREALAWLNEILKVKKNVLREDIASYSHILNLMVHFELGHIGVLKYAVDACRRFLKKKRELHDFERVLLNFFSRLSMARRDQYGQLFTQLRDELFARTNEELKSNALDYLNFEAWIAEKLGQY